MILCGDAAAQLQTIAAQTIDTCVTSPPYYGLRSYNTDGQIGLEQTYQEYIARLVDVFRAVRRVLRDDGTLWIVIGDSYANDGKWGGSTGGKHVKALHGSTGIGRRRTYTGLPSKNLIGIPWRLAIALQDDGWYLRNDIIWCLSGGTCLYAKTQKGEAHSALKDLARLNPETVKLWNGSKWTQVLKWTKSESKNDKIEIVLRSGERIGATGEHLWPTQRGIVQTKGLMVGDTIESCALPEPDNAKVPEYLTDDLLWLIGLFMAEGSFCGDVVQLSLCVDELPWFDKIKSAVEHLGCTCTYSICGNTLSVRLYGKVINAVIKNFIKYTSAHDVHLDARVWAFPNQALRIITQGYLDGDGHIEKNRIRIGFCRNYYLESDLRTLAARLGATITLNLSTATLNGEKYKAFRGEWRWSRSGHLNEKSRNEIVSIGRSRGRSFWDITVEDEPNLFALASGILTHNCKPNAMPESVKDRCTRSHEYIFLLAKSPHYYFDAEAVREPAVKGDPQSPRGSKGQPKLNGGRRHAQVDKPQVTTRNRRDVWTVSTKPFKGAHFATFPPDLIRPCILAGCKPGGTVLDPFCGSGTTGFVALATGRQFVGIDINPEYCEMAAERIGTTERSK